MGRMSDAKERLVASAAELIYARGYRGVSVDEICASAGVKKGSFYYFFPSKQALTLAAVDAQWRFVEDGLVATTFGHDRPPLERIRRFFDLMVQASALEQEAQGHVGGCRFGNLAAEMASHDPTIRDTVQRVFHAIAAYFEQALREAVAAGEVGGLDPAECAQALLAYMEGILLLGRTYNDPDLMRRLAAKAVVLTVSGG